MTKTTKTLSIILLSLIALFAFSFVLSGKKTEVIQASFINNSKNVSVVKMSYENSFLTLTNYGDFWGAELNSNSTTLFFPCDTQVVENFLKASALKNNLYKVSDNLKQWEVLGLTENESFSVQYFDENSNVLSSIFFGKINPSSDRISFRTNKSISSYQVDSDILNYLKIESKFWADPYLVPRSVSGVLSSNLIQSISYSVEEKPFTQVSKSNFAQIANKIGEYRHSNIALEIIESKPCRFAIQIEDGIGNIYVLRFYENTDSSFIVKNTITPSSTRDSDVKSFCKKINYVSVISSWTFNQITSLVLDN